MTVSDSESLAPFSLNLVSKQGSTGIFVVNIGEINSRILQTYKHRSTTSGTTAINELYFTDKLTGVLQPVDESIFAPIGDSGPIFKVGSSYNKTFSAIPSASGCSVYLRIPKIPEGFDYRNALVDGIGKDIWWLDSKADFLNQFDIITSQKSGFAGLTSGDFRHIESGNRFRDPNFNYYGNFSQYRFQEVVPEHYGKVYIKLADVNVGDVDKVTPFFRSNVVNPSKYIRTGALNLRYIKILYVTAHLNSFSLFSAKPETIPFPNVFENNNTFNYPPFFGLSIENIREQVVDKLKEFISNFNQRYAENILYTFPRTESDPGLTPKNEDEDEGPLEGLKVIGVFLVYKLNLGSKVVIENVLEDFEGYEELWKIGGPLNEDGVPTPIRRLKESDIYTALGVNKEDDLFQLIGFEES